MRRTIAAIAAAALIATATPASADHKAGHLRPAGPAASHFPADFTAPVDTEWNFPIGGFGGTLDTRTSHLPVVMVHGNNSDHATWFLVADRMTKQLGWGQGDMWALSYNGVGCTNDGALFTPNTGYNGWTYQADRSSSQGCVVTADDNNVADLKAFIDAVMAYTGAPKVNIIAHSLGVTVARKTMKVYDLYDRVAGFVAIAGANHGTSFCPPGSEGLVMSCDEIAADTPWLADLNSPTEVPGPTKWMTIYDGTGVGDPAFAGPKYAQSPRLEGADNREFPYAYHNDLRVNPSIIDVYAAFLASAESAS